MAASIFKWLLLGVLGISHPFFVSVTEINHNAKEKTLEVSCKLFLDDMEKTYKKETNTTIELNNPKDPKKVQEWLLKYLKQHLQLQIDGKPVVLEWVGYEVEGASIWTYFQVSNITSVHKIDISNNILYEMYDTQIGIIHAQVAGEKKSTRITYPETKAGFVF